MNPQPSCIDVLAQGGGIRVLRHLDGCIVQGLSHYDIVFLDKNEWNLFMAVMQIADARINGVKE